MEKKDLQKQRALLLKEIEAEEKKLKAAEHKLSLYEYQELEKEQKAKKPTAKKAAKKKPAKNSKVKSKPVNKNEGANRQNMKKHVIVPASELNNYDFDKRKKDWHEKSGMNQKQEICSICGDDDNWESILLDNKKHVCYYCWIKKPTEEDSKKSKKEEKADKKQKAKEENARAIATKKESSTASKDAVKSEEESKPVGKLFYIIAITLGILLIALIIIIVLGIVSNWTFQF